MRRARCPYCNNVNVIEDGFWGQIANCEAPRCGRVFQTGVEEAALQATASAAAATATRSRSMPPIPTPATPPPKPRLTGAHRCHDCGGELGQAIGRRRATVVHRLQAQGDRPAGAHCRMDIYAALYYCPNSHCQIFLETPRYQWGQNVTCPARKVEFVAPLDDVLHEHEGDAREGQVFLFSCPSCEAHWRCDSTRQGQPLSGRRVVCHRCCNVIEIPGGGTAIGQRGPSVPDPREALQQGGERRCGNADCGRMIPTRAEHCPVCGMEQTGEAQGP